MNHRNLIIAFLLTLLPVEVRAQTAALATSSIESKEFDAPSTGGKARIRVQLPAFYAESETARLPVIYFLHGLYGSDRKWEGRGAPKIIDAMIAAKKIPPVIVVCPNGQNSFYINAKGKENSKYEDLITKDLVAFVDQTYRTIASREGRALLGDSMGGYGALLQAMKHPEVFSAVASHEGSVFPEDRSKLPTWAQRGRGGQGPGLLGQLFGDPVDEEAWLTNNLFHIAKNTAEGKLDGVRIYFDVGKDDRFGLAAPSEEFSKVLEARKVKHTFVLRDGTHGREFFNENLPESLLFLGEAFARVKTGG